MPSSKMAVIFYSDEYINRNEFGMPIFLSCEFSKINFYFLYICTPQWDSQNIRIVLSIIFWATQSWPGYKTWHLFPLLILPNIFPKRFDFQKKFFNPSIPDWVILMACYFLPRC